MDDNRLLQDILFELREQRGGIASENISSGNKKDSRSYGEKVDDLIKSSKDATVQFNKLNSGLKLTSRAQFEHRLAAEDARRELSQLEEALRKHRNGTRLLTGDQLKEVEARRKGLESTQKQSQAGDRFAASLTRWGGFLINYFTAVQTATISGISNVLSTIQAGGSGFAIANATMAMQLDIANAHAQQMGNAMQMAGSAVMALPTIGAKIAGAGIMLKGQADAAASNLKTMAEKAYNQLLMTGGEQVLKAYKDLTKAGVIVAGGADQMNEALRGRGGKLVISFDELNRMVQENVGTLARARMGTGEAALMMGRVAKVIRENKMERGLAAIGIGIEDFGGIVASTMADMRYNNPSRVLNVPELTAKSIEYAKQLALLSTLTGKSVKELKDRGKEAEGELAYQNFMARIKDPKVKEAFDLLPKFARQSAVEMATFSHIRNDQGRLMAQTVPGFQAMVNEFSGGLRTGKISVDDITRIQNKYAKTIVEGARRNETLNVIAAAGNTKYQGFTEQLSTFIMEMEGYTQNIGKLKTAVDKQFKEATEGPKPGEKPTMSQTLTDIDNAGKTLVAEFQGKIIDKIPEIGKLIEKALKDANKLVDQGPGAVRQGDGGLGQISNMMEMLMGLGVLASIAQVVGGYLLARFMSNQQTAILKSEIEKLKEGKGGVTEQGKGAVVEEGKAARAVAEPTAPRTSSIIDPATGKPFVLESGPTPAQVAKAAAAEKEIARLAKVTKMAGTGTRALGYVGTAIQVGMTGKEVYDLQQAVTKGTITRDQADVAQTGAVTQGATTLALSAAGGIAGFKLGTFIGAIFAPATAGLSIPIGAALGTLIGGIGGAIVSLLGDWPRKLGESLSKWWKSWTFKGVWDDLGKGLENVWGGLSSFASQVGSWTKSAWSWLTGSDKPTQGTAPANTTTNNAAAQPGALSGKQLAFWKNALIVALATDGGNVIQFSKESLNELRGAIRESGTGTTRPSTSTFYDPNTKKGKVFTEKDFFEYGKGDPLLYAMGKLMKINGEAVEVLRAIAINAKAQVTNTGDTANVLGRIRKQTAFN